MSEEASSSEDHRRAHARRIAAARAYQPKTVRLLLVASAPPVDPARYFYFEAADSADELFLGVCEVLFEAPPGAEKTPYLKELKRRGVFVIEMRPDGAETEVGARDAGPWLMIRCQDLRPQVLVVIGSEPYGEVAEPLRKAGLPLIDKRVPFPSAGNEVAFRRELRAALVRAELEALIRPLRAKQPPAPRRAAPSNG
jgi:hypothetical protein